MDKKLNNKTIKYIIYIDKSLREKEESRYKVRKGFPQAHTAHMPHGQVTPKSPQGRPYLAAI